MSNGKKMWYYRTYDEFGRRTAGKSTGETSKTKANIYCMELFKREQLIPDSSRKLGEYIAKKNFFVWGQCSYCIEQGVKQTYANDCYSRMTNHIIPILGGISFDNLSSKTINAWQSNLLVEKKLSAKTVRECRTVLNIILSTARNEGFLSKDVFEGVKKLPQHHKLVRGILSDIEVRNLFDMKNYKKFWNENHLYYTASLLACFSGMRQGEILALTPEKVFHEHIYVNASWGKNGLGPTKTGETRQVYIKKEVMKQLQSIMPESGYIFSFNGKTPLSGNRLTDALYKALDVMEIDEKQRKERNLTFHSFRHWLVTYLRGKGVSEAEIQKITGHKTLAMVGNYTSFDMLSNANAIKALEGF